jgi:antitoxin component YwqK of YwqJK toxin-antitoxin module
MKNLLLLTLFITFILQGCGGELVYNKEEHSIKNGGENGMTYRGEFYSGKYIRYHDDGTLSKVYEKGSYLNGNKNGVWEEYYDNGQLLSKCSYLNGEMDGVWEYYNEDGSLLFTHTY